jgi:hypothetical protein
VPFVLVAVFGAYRERLAPDAPRAEPERELVTA